MEYTFTVDFYVPTTEDFITEQFVIEASSRSEAGDLLDEEIERFIEETLPDETEVEDSTLINVC